MSARKKSNKKKDGDLPNKPEKHIPAKPDKNPDPTKEEPNKNDPTRIEEPGKTDPTRIDEPPPPKYDPPTKK